MRSDKSVVVHLQVARMLVLQKVVLSVYSMDLVFPEELVVVQIKSKKVVLVSNSDLAIFDLFQELSITVKAHFIFINERRHGVAAI